MKASKMIPNRPRTDTDIRLIVEVWMNVSKEYPNVDRSSFWKQVQDACARKGVTASIAAIRTLWSIVLGHVEAYQAAIEELESRSECDPCSPTELPQDKLFRTCVELSKCNISFSFHKKYLTAVRFLLSQPEFTKNKHVIKSLDRFRRSRILSKLKNESVLQEDVETCNDTRRGHKRSAQTDKITRSLKISRLAENPDTYHRDMPNEQIDSVGKKRESENRGDSISQDVVTVASLTEVAQTLRRSIDNYCNILEQQLDVKLLEVMPDSREKDRLCVEVFEERYARIQQRKKEQINRIPRPSSEHSYDSNYQDS